MKQAKGACEDDYIVKLKFCFIMAKLKANIAYIPVVESINRKFALRKNTCSINTIDGTHLVLATEVNKFMGGATRTTNRAGVGTCTRNYMFFRENPRSSATTQEERDRRNLFGQIGAVVPIIFKDLSQLTRMTEMWVEALADASKACNGISAKGYTWRGWVFAVQYAGKLASSSYDITKFPTSFDA